MIYNLHCAYFLSRSIPVLKEKNMWHLFLFFSRISTREVKSFMKLHLNFLHIRQFGFHYLKWKANTSSAKPRISLPQSLQYGTSKFSSRLTLNFVCSKKKVPDQLLVCRIGDLWRTWMIPNWLYMRPNDCSDHPGSILYH